MYTLAGPVGSRVFIPRTLHQGSQLFKADPSIYLYERSFDQVLELGDAECPGSAEREEVSPGLRGEATALVGSKDAKSHGIGIRDWGLVDRELLILRRPKLFDSIQMEHRILALGCEFYVPRQGPVAGLLESG